GLPRGVRHRDPGVLTRSGGRQPAHRHRAHLRFRALATPAPTGGLVMTAGRSTRRAWWKTVLGVLVTLAMLFPVYWMVNVSFTRTPDLRRRPPNWFPWDPTFDGYAAVLDQQLPALGTSLVLGLGCVALTLVVAAPAGYALALLNLRGGRSLNFLLLVAQMIPAVVMAMGFYAVYNSLGLLNTLWGLIIADSTIA